GEGVILLDCERHDSTQEDNGVTYECIPQLLARLSGNDDQKIIDCQSLPQHTGLNLVDVLEAEHHPELTVKPVMEIGPDGWGEWDYEMDDRRVKYMVRLIEDGHKFKKSMCRGGDAAEDLYDHEKRKAANKRKRLGSSSRTNAGGPCVEAKTVEHLLQEAKLGRRKRMGVTPRKEMFCSRKRLKEKRRRVQQRLRRNICQMRTQKNIRIYLKHRL
ncbi:unnamed protein product, partial [Brassica oleracea var. botrytis]